MGDNDTVIRITGIRFNGCRRVERRLANPEIPPDIGFHNVLQVARAELFSAPFSLTAGALVDPVVAGGIRSRAVRQRSRRSSVAVNTQCLGKGVRTFVSRCRPERRCCIDFLLW